jgi:DNA-binding transcriptional ArsR family regulator
MLAHRKQYFSFYLSIALRVLILKPMLNNEVDRAFNALAEPTRRAIVEKLSAGPVSASALAEPFDMTLAAVLQHLRVLEDSGIVRTRKVGRVRTCQLEPAGLNVAARWLNERRALWERRLDRLEKVLDRPLPSVQSKRSISRNNTKRRKP